MKENTTMAERTMTITITIADDATAGQINVDPPDAPTQDVGAALIEALIAMCARGGLSREHLSEILRTYADNIEDMPDDAYKNKSVVQ
ncbi:MAG: hypothetical protein WAK55_19455 [Xanthobacteraceae bacterium]